MLELKAKRVSEALVGLLGLWFIASALPFLASALFEMVTQPEAEIRLHGMTMAAYQIIPGMTGIVVGWMLLMFRQPLSRWLTPTDREYTWTSQALLAVGTALLGILFTAQGASGAASRLITAWLDTRPFFESLAYTDSFWSPLASLVIGVGLFLWSTRIAQVWQQRTSPVPAASQAEPAED